MASSVTTDLSHCVYIQGDKIIKRITCDSIRDYQEKAEHVYNGIIGDNDAFFEYFPGRFICKHPLIYAKKMSSCIIERMRGGKDRKAEFDFWIPNLTVSDIEEDNFPDLESVALTDRIETFLIPQPVRPSVTIYSLRDSESNTLKGVFCGEHEKPCSGKVDVIARFPS
jgi:hypothetical protein